MSLALDRPEFAPPPQRGTPRAVVLALIAHALLIAALLARLPGLADQGEDFQVPSRTEPQAMPEPHGNGGATTTVEPPARRPRRRNAG